MNISDIAKLAGVAPATVSRYLNNGYVSAEKKDKIRRVIAETGYMPKNAAPSVNIGKSNLIAVIIPHLNWCYVAQMVEGIIDELNMSDRRPVIITTGGLQERELEQLRLFRDNEFDGVIFYSRRIAEEHSKVLASYNKPVVIMGQYEKNTPCVYYDDYNAAYTAVKHLVTKGCTRIAHIYTKIVNNAAGRSRIDGCFDALKDSGLRYIDRLMSESEFNSKGGRSAMLKILAEGTRFDGVLCASDTIAVGVMGLLKERGISVPDEVKVVSVGNSPYASLVSPMLTSVSYNRHAAGREACKILMERIGGDTRKVKRYKLGFELIERESTR